jgi:cobalt-precorrin 5A hydrolase
MFVEKKIAIVTLTKGGQKLALQLKNILTNVDVYSPRKLKCKRHKVIYYYSSLKELTANLFKQYSNIIYIMSLGIVVRIIAPYLKNKRVDPAILTMDETAKNVISTLSGHLGGANQLTRKIARILNSNEVITTATDCQDKPAVDLLAKKMDCIIEPFQKLKLANSAIVNGRSLNIFTDYNINLSETDKISIYPLSLYNSENMPRGFPVVISNKKIYIANDYLQLIPQNIIIGIGCRRGISVNKIRLAVDKALKVLNIKKNSIKKLATIDLKKDELGLLKYAEEKSLKLDIIDRDKIKKADLKINRSEFVEKITGVPGVCEPAALLSSTQGKLIMPKTKYNKVTVAVVEEEVNNE